MNDIDARARLQPAANAPVPEAAAAPQEETLDIVEYWRAISKRRWSIVGLTILVAAIATLVVFNMRPTYRSSASILIDQGKTRVVSIEEVYAQGMIQREFFQTQVELLKSEELARKVVAKLNLTQHPDFDPRQAQPNFWERYLVLPPLPWLEPKAAPTEESAVKAAVKKLRENTQVQLVRNSHIATVSFVAYDKELAAKVPNTLAETYIENDLESRIAMTAKATEWLGGRMTELKAKVDESERALQTFRDRERIVDVKGVAVAGASKQLEELTKNLVEARAKKAEAEGAYNLIREIQAGKSQASYDSIPAVLRHPLVQKAKEAETDAERRLAEAGKRYGAEHPVMVKARAEIDAARANMRRQIDVVVAGFQREYDSAAGSERAIERALNQSKADIQSFNRKEFQLGLLEREVSQNRNLYDMFVKRQKETSTAGDLQSTIARVVDPARVPSTAHAPKKAQVVGIAAAVALVLSAMLALLLDRLANSINSTSAVEHRLGLPALGVLQLVKQPGSKKKGFASEFAFFNDTQSVFAEAVRTVRTSVLMSALDEPHKVVVVTSSVPGEGKTTLSFNLACALGQVKKVLLIDADVRRPMIARLLSHDTKSPGLADLVAGTADESQTIFRHEKAGIDVLPAGTVPPNPLELLSSARFDNVLETLRKRYDLVVMDTPPVQLVSDALVISQHASEVIYVVRADSTPWQVAQNGIRRLKRMGAPLIGAVLNQLDLEKAEKYYGEYSGYRSYKGYRKYGYYRGYGKTYGA